MATSAPATTASSSKIGIAPNIVVRPHSFNTRIAYDLVLALDQELAAMYPDWDDLVHPNIKSDNHNPNHKDALLKEDTPRPVIADNNDFDDAASVSHDGTAAYKDLKFFVAFDTNMTTTGSSSEQSSLPVGCVAPNPMPYFPSHHALAQPASSMTPLSSSSSQSQQNGEQQQQQQRLSTVELKRMYVVPGYRGRGVASKLLLYAIEYARTEMGMQRLVLETGIRQKASVALYERHRFAYRDMFGDWVGAGVEDGGISVCMEKMLV